MLLTHQRHEIHYLPWMDQRVYDLCKWRDEHSSLGGRIVVQIALCASFVQAFIDKLARYCIQFFTACKQYSSSGLEYKVFWKNLSAKPSLMN